MAQRSECGYCGRKFEGGEVLVGWQACRCGGHRYHFCRDDKGGCGETTYDPPILDDTCESVSFGYQGTA